MGLGIQFDYQFLFRNLTFKLKAGQMLQILGANGSGKSTLLKLLAGLVCPSEGRVEWRGQSVQGGDPVFVQDLHYIGQPPSLYSALTAAENLELSLSLKTCGSDFKAMSNVTASCYSSGLISWIASTYRPRNDENDVITRRSRSNPGEISITWPVTGFLNQDLLSCPAAYLSAGQRQRLRLAVLELLNKPLWILDEPLNALDSAARKHFLNMLQQHLIRQGMAVIASHIELSNNSAFPDQLIKLDLDSKRDQKACG